MWRAVWQRLIGAEGVITDILTFRAGFEGSFARFPVVYSNQHQFSCK